jgi:hypothetical protein
MRILYTTLAALAVLAPLPATTLQKLEMDDLIAKSNAVVRAKVIGSHTALRGADIYTFYQLAICENLKPGGSQPTEVAVQGGSYRGSRQLVAGAPVLTNGQEYVFFLWTSRSGLSVILGLTQGLYQTGLDATGQPVMMRPASVEPMVDQNGRATTDQAITLQLSDLRTRIQKVTAAK